MTQRVVISMAKYFVYIPVIVVACVALPASIVSVQEPRTSILRGEFSEVRQELQSSADTESQIRAMNCLAEFRDMESVPLLIELVDDDDPSVRRRALAAVEAILGVRFGFDPNAPVEVWTLQIDKLQREWKACEQSSMERRK